MNKYDLFISGFVTAMCVLCTIGCIGAYFYNWTWHNLLLGAFFGWFAYVWVSETLKELKKNKEAKK